MFPLLFHQIDADGIHGTAFEVELVIIRDVPKDSRYSTQLLDWLKAVIIDACDNRRNVRVQFSTYYYVLH